MSVNLQLSCTLDLEDQERWDVFDNGEKRAQVHSVKFRIYGSKIFASIDKAYKYKKDGTLGNQRYGYISPDSIPEELSKRAQALFIAELETKKEELLKETKR